MCYWKMFMGVVIEKIDFVSGWIKVVDGFDFFVFVWMDVNGVGIFFVDV